VGFDAQYYGNLHLFQKRVSMNNSFLHFNKFTWTLIDRDDDDSEIVNSIEILANT